MKMSMWSLILALGLMAFVSCDNVQHLDPLADSNTYVDPADLPSPVQTYISTNHSNLTIYEVELYDECGEQFYEVEFTNGLELYFDLQGNFLGTDDPYNCDDDDGYDDDGKYIDPDSLPANALTYIANNYPNLTIYEAELYHECGEQFYEVEFTNGLELYFDLQGNFLGTDDPYDCDDDDGYDDDYIDPDSLPANVLSYIAANYPNDSIYEAEKEFECGIEVYEVELSSGLELYFDMQGNFLGTDNPYDCDDDDGYDDGYIDPDSLPSNIHTYISANYPNSTIYEAELETDCDEDVYVVTLNSGEELYFDMQGNFLGTNDTYGCDDDDDYIDPSTLPSNIHTYISANYPNSTIYEAELETDCDEDVYVVTLNSGEELYFDMQGNFLGTDDTYDCDDDDD